MASIVDTSPDEAAPPPVRPEGYQTRASAHPNLSRWQNITPARLCVSQSVTRLRFGNLTSKPVQTSTPQSRAHVPLPLHLPGQAAAEVARDFQRWYGASDVSIASEHDEDGDDTHDITTARQAATTTKAKLSGMKLGELRKYASDHKLMEAAVDEALDSDDPKAALVALLLQSGGTDTSGCGGRADDADGVSGSDGGPRQAGSKQVEPSAKSLAAAERDHKAKHAPTMQYDAAPSRTVKPIQPKAELPKLVPLTPRSPAGPAPAKTRPIKDEKGVVEGSSEMVVSSRW